MTIFSKSFVFILIFSFGFYLMYNQAFNKFPSDTKTHIYHAAKFAPGKVVEVSYPMWHASVYVVSKSLGVDLKYGAALVTAFVIMALAMSIFTIVKWSLKDELPNLSFNQKEYLFLGMTITLMVMAAVYVPFFNKRQFLGQASCGVWHNVTLLMVKPFALFSLYTLVKYLETKQLKWMLISALIILLSIYAKPSFIIAFLPAVFMFFVLFVMRQMKLNVLQVFTHIIDIFKRFKQEILFLIILAFLSALILWAQYISIYNGENTQNKVIFDFLGVWSFYSPNIFGSLLLTYLFPLAVLLFVNQKKSNTYYLSLITTVVAVLLLSCFAEEGRYHDGNFGWSQQVAVQMFFVMSLIEFVKNYSYLQNWKIYIISITLSLHIISGVFYLGKILKGLSYA